MDDLVDLQAKSFVKVVRLCLCLPCWLARCHSAFGVTTLVSVGVIHTASRSPHHTTCVCLSACRQLRQSANSGLESLPAALSERYMLVLLVMHTSFCLHAYMPRNLLHPDAKSPLAKRWPGPFVSLFVHRCAAVCDAHLF